MELSPSSSQHCFRPRSLPDRLWMTCVPDAPWSQGLSLSSFSPGHSEDKPPEIHRPRSGAVAAAQFAPSVEQTVSLWNPRQPGAAARHTSWDRASPGSKAQPLACPARDIPRATGLCSRGLRFPSLLSLFQLLREHLLWARAGQRGRVREMNKRPPPLICLCFVLLFKDKEMV